VAGYLNESEVEDCERVFHLDGHVNLYRGAQVVHALMDYADDHSDGWAYWVAPRNAAANLITTLDDSRRRHLRGRRIADITGDDLTRLLSPVKAFLTREGVSHHALPWAALLPLT
jgi:hypothetical protein